MRAALYARASTKHQDTEIQVQAIREYIAARGWTAAGEYVDAGVSGRRASRPQLDRLMLAVRRRQVDVVIVHRLDRFGRSVQNMLQHLKDLECAGVRFVAITQAIDTDKQNPMSRLFLTILAAIAEFERELIVERVTAGVRAAQAKGKRVGRPRAVIDVDRIRAMRDAGIACETIARQFGVSRNTLYRRLEVE